MAETSFYPPQLFPSYTSRFTLSYPRSSLADVSAFQQCLNSEASTTFLKAFNGKTTFESALALSKDKAMESSRIQFDVHLPADAKEKEAGGGTVWAGVLGLLKLKGTGLSSDGQTERTGEVGAIIAGPYQSIGIFSEAMITIFDLAFNVPANHAAPIAPAAIATQAQSHSTPTLSSQSGFALDKLFLVTTQQHSAMRHWMEVVLGIQSLKADSKKLTKPYRDLLERQAKGNDPDPYIVYCIEKEDWFETKRDVLVRKVVRKVEKGQGNSKIHSSKPHEELVRINAVC